MGTCSVSERSSTWPPLIVPLLETHLVKQLVKRVERLFPLTNWLQAGPAIIEAAMLRVALADLYEGTVRDVP